MARQRAGCSDRRRPRPKRNRHQLFSHSNHRQRATFAALPFPHHSARRYLHATAWPHVAGSTVIVEAPAERSRPIGIVHRRRILAFCRNYFADELDGAPPTARRRGSRSSPSATGSWYAGKTVAASAARPTRRTFRSGSTSARSLEDAEALADLLGTHASVDDALKAFDAARRPKAESLQRAAGASQSWFEQADRRSASRSSSSCSRCSPPACASPMRASKRRRPSWCARSMR